MSRLYTTFASMQLDSSRASSPRRRPSHSQTVKLSTVSSPHSASYERRITQLNNVSLLLLTADFVFLGTGITPNSAFMKAFDPSLVNDAGYIKVKPTLQLKTDTGALDNVFVIGDVTDVLVRFVLTLRR